MPDAEETDELGAEQARAEVDVLMNMLTCDEQLDGATPDREGAIGFLRRVGVWGFDDPHGGR